MYRFREHSLRLPIALKKNPALVINGSSFKNVVVAKKTKNAVFDKIFLSFFLTKKRILRQTSDKNLTP
jgi:hypothetical protein